MTARKFNSKRRSVIHKSGATFKMSVLALAMIAANTHAQEQDAPVVEEILITGYKGALKSSTEAKRNSIGFKDQVFADDLGKMPSLNLAESLARIPGVRINRQHTGEGQQISVRGLGPEFTKVVLNGNSINIASTGDINSTSAGREVDLDVFPTEIFSSLEVDKTINANQIEGGVTGYVNMRTMKASDIGDGHHGKFAVEENYREADGSYSPKFVASYSFSNEKFGALVTTVHSDRNSRVDGYETVGNISQTGCLITNVMDSVDCRDPDVSATFRFADVASADYATVHPGVTAGDILDIYQTSGLTKEQLEAVGMPYIGRLMTTQGDKKSSSTLISLQYTPSEDLEFTYDIIGANANHEFVRTEVMHIYRRNYDTPYIPVDVIAEDNGNGSRLVSGTFYGNSPWVGSRDYDTDLSFLSHMPSLRWDITDDIRMKASASQTRSSFVRDSPYGLFYTAPGTLTYKNDGDVPTVVHSAYEDYGNYSWQSLRTGHDERSTNTEAVHVDFFWGEADDQLSFKWGAAIDEMKSEQTNYGIEHGGLGDYLDAHGMSYVTDNLGDYITPVTLGSNIDGYKGSATVGDLNWSQFKGAIDYDGIGMVPTSLKLISEKASALYGEASGYLNIGSTTLRGSAGVRFVDTDQYVATLKGETIESYTSTLPSLNLVLDATESIKVRFSASESLARANPSDMYPNSNWASSGIDTVNTGNPELEPFESTNIDIGGEWYFGDLGYVGITHFRKKVTGFTTDKEYAVDFNDLHEWGMDTSDLSQTQQDALSVCGPPCIVMVKAKQNIDGETTVDGFEAVWVQPLDMWVEGLGFNASYTTIDAENEKGDEIPGISDSYNVTAYYENEGLQARLTYYYQEGSYAFESSEADVNDRDRAQVDFAASYLLDLGGQEVTFTFDAYNLTNESLSNYLEGDDNQTYNAYYPGVVYTFGLHTSF